MPDVDSRFDDVLPPRRGRRQPKSSAAESPADVARSIVELLNSKDCPPESSSGDGLQELVSERGLLVTEHLSLSREYRGIDWDFCGFMVMLAVGKGRPDFAAIRLHHYQADDDRRPYAELLLLDGS